MPSPYSDLILAAGVGLVLAAVWGLAYWLVYARYPAFDEYRERYPHLCRNGRCYCHCCGGGRIYVERLDIAHRRHLCMTCGEILYRS